MSAEKLCAKGEKLCAKMLELSSLTIMQELVRNDVKAPLPSCKSWCTIMREPLYHYEIL